MNLTLRTNFKQIEVRLRELQTDVGGRALASTLNKTLDQSRTLMQRTITDEYKVKPAYVRERLRVDRASFRNGAFSISASLIGGRGNKRSANVIAFVEKSVSLGQARKRAKAGQLNDLFVQIKAKGGKKRLAAAFIGNKGRTVFRRVPGSKMASRTGNSKHSEKIAPVQTIDVAQMFNARRVSGAVVKFIEEKLPIVFEREARFYVDRFNRAGK